MEFPKIEEVRKIIEKEEKDALNGVLEEIAKKLQKLKEENGLRRKIALTLNEDRVQLATIDKLNEALYLHGYLIENSECYGKYYIFVRGLK